MSDISLSSGSSHFPTILPMVVSPVNFDSRFTIVSALITNINQRGDRDIQKYVDLGYHLLDVNVKQIVFMERSVFDTHFYSRYFPTILFPVVSPANFDYKGKTYSYVVFGRITFVFFEKQDMYLWDFKSDITEFEVDTPQPTKDTLEYMFVQCHKTEWIAIAISLENLPGNYYVWMDFGIRHMFPSDIAFDMEIYLLRDRIAKSRPTIDGPDDKVYAPSCWNANCVYYQNIYRQIHWIFAGSVFGGNSGILLEFAKKTKEKCLSIICEKRRLMWEVNVWYMVFLECRELFSLYHGDHNASILRGFLQNRIHI